MEPSVSVPNLLHESPDITAMLDKFRSLRWLKNRCYPMSPEIESICHDFCPIVWLSCQHVTNALPLVWGKTLIFCGLYRRKPINLSESDERALMTYKFSDITVKLSGGDVNWHLQPAKLLSTLLLPQPPVLELVFKYKQSDCTRASSPVQTH